MQIGLKIDKTYNILQDNYDDSFLIAIRHLSTKFLYFIIFLRASLA